MFRITSEGKPMSIQHGSDMHPLPVGAAFSGPDNTGNTKQIGILARRMGPAVTSAGSGGPDELVRFTGSDCLPYVLARYLVLALRSDVPDPAFRPGPDRLLPETALTALQNACPGLPISAPARPR
ncbi:hypothetical protein ACWGF3_22690 [Streptomyces xanthophaeus]